MSAQTNFSAKAKTYLYYNPTFVEQQKSWSSDQRICVAEAQRKWKTHLIVVLFLADYSRCVAQTFIRSKIEPDVAEAIAQKLDLEYSWFVPRPDIIAGLAAYIPPILSNGRTLMFVAHSQGNMVVEQALRAVHDSIPLDSKPQYCTALLSLATPLAPSSFILLPRYRRHLTVEYDILRQLGMEFGITELRTPDSEEARSVLATINPLLKPKAYLATKLAWGEQVHGAKSNYFEPDSSQSQIKKYLEELQNECTEPDWP